MPKPPPTSDTGKSEGGSRDELLAFLGAVVVLGYVFLMFALMFTGRL